MSLLDNFKADAALVKNAVVSLFTSVKSKLVAFFSAGASAIATSIEKQLPEAGEEIVTFVETAALDAVTAAEVTPGGGTAKMTAALAAFAVDLATKGITLAETEMRALLENALLQFKAATATAPVPATAAPASGA